MALSQTEREEETETAEEVATTPRFYEPLGGGVNATAAAVASA